MTDAVISAVVDGLTSLMLSNIKEEVKLVSGVNDEIKKLVSNFKSTQALLDDAEERQLKEASVKYWLLNLKAVSYDMDDMLDEWKTWIQTSQLQHLHDSSNSSQNHLKHKVLSICRCICFTTSDVGLRHVVARKIREFRQRLDDIATDKVRYQLTSPQQTNKHIERDVPTSFIDIQKVKGRDEQKDEVKSKILQAKSNPYIISLVGLGGIGKTTLAQLVYNDSEIETHFEKKIWVCISKPFDKISIAKLILESLGNSSSAPEFKELEDMLKEISKVLNKKRFLLVLDDVWNENRRNWEELEKIFKCGLPGSTILITTCNERVAINMGCNLESIHKVGFLTSEECWSIISQIALVQGDRQKLESIGRRIADKCKGLPLAAVTVGGLLLLKESEKEWLRVFESNGWDSEDILDSLKISYYDLPLPLKQCFSYCATFLKDSKIQRRRLISMWMAQGYLKGKEEEEDLEMIGEIYLDNLIARCLLQISSDDDDCCILHDMVSDLAQTFTKDECLMIEILNDTEFNENSLHANANARHLTLVTEKGASFPVYIYNLTKLRSLIIQFLGYGSSLTVDVVKNIFDHLTCLRTLDLSRCGIEEVPSSINRLFHLRWLDLSGNKNLERLPESLCECYNLQTLNLTYCIKLVELPQGIGKLIKLMYLDIEGCDEIIYIPKGIGNLWRLKEMRYFLVCMYENGASSIVEMEKLNNLRRSLKIRGLGNVRKVEEARKAQLKEKKNVTDLSLSFDGDHVQEDEEELLEALEPPLDLEILSIEEYEGQTLFPSWVMNLHLLRVLRITSCRNCEELPPLGKLSSLEELYMEKMMVTRVGVEFLGIEKEDEMSTSFVSFPKLKKLQFSEFLEWKEWDDVDRRFMKSFQNTNKVMPCLQHLGIRGCPKLKRLPYHLLSPTITGLQQLEINFCDVLQQRIQKHKRGHIPYLFTGQEVTGRVWSSEEEEEQGIFQVSEEERDSDVGQFERC